MGLIPRIPLETQQTAKKCWISCDPERIYSPDGQNLQAGPQNAREGTELDWHSLHFLSIGTDSAGTSYPASEGNYTIPSHFHTDYLSAFNAVSRRFFGGVHSHSHSALINTPYRRQREGWGISALSDTMSKPPSIEAVSESQ